MISHYEERIIDGFGFAYQLAIVRKIANSDYADSLFPNTSHDSLVISRIEDYENSLNYPTVCIQYFGEDNFEITYSPKLKQTHNIIKQKCNLKNVWSYLESLFLRQKIETDQ